MDLSDRSVGEVSVEEVSVGEVSVGEVSVGEVSGNQKIKGVSFKRVVGVRISTTITK